MEQGLRLRVETIDAGLDVVAPLTELLSLQSVRIEIVFQVDFGCTATLSPEVCRRFQP